jgi:hypothetical protein
VSGRAVRRHPSYVQLPGLASGEVYLVAAAVDTQAGRAVAGSREEEGRTGQAAVGLAVGTDHVAAVAVVGCEAAVVRRHLL